MNELATTDIITDELTDGLIFDPDRTAGIVKELHANTLLNIIELGRHLILAKERLDHGEFGLWIKESCGFSYSSARSYMQIAKRYYPYKNEIIDMKAFAFKAVAKLPDDLFDEAMKTGKLEGKDVNELSKRDVLNMAEKAKAGEEIEKRKRIEKEKQIELGKVQLTEKDKEIEKLEDQIEDLKNPNKLCIENLKKAQDLINEAVFSIQKASIINIEQRQATDLLSSLVTTIKSVQTAWGVRWDDRLIRR